MRISDFIERCDVVSAPADVFDLFREALQHLGYDVVAFTPITPAARQALGQAEIAPAMAANVPQRWVEHYFANGYQNFDPVLLRTPFAGEPLVWDKVLRGESLTPRQRRVLSESRDAGLYNGASVPLHGPSGETYAVSLASLDPRVDGTENLAKVQLLSVQFLLSYGRSVRRRKLAADAVQVTDRERECLTWTARGKSAWAIGQILGVSEHTVNFHIKQSMEKLGVGNRMQAVVAAVRLGLILP